jgi:hypothetical protein
VKETKPEFAITLKAKGTICGQEGRLDQTQSGLQTDLVCMQSSLQFSRLAHNKLRLKRSSTLVVEVMLGIFAVAKHDSLDQHDMTTLLEVTLLRL